MKRGPLCVLGCYVLWGSLPAFWKLLNHLNSLYVLGNRIVWAMIFTGLFLAVRGRLKTPVQAAFGNKRELVRLIAASCAITLNWGVYIWAAGHGHMLDSSLAYYLNPILTVLLGMLVFHERLSGLQWLAVAVAFSGIVIAVIRYQRIPGVALIVGGSFAVYGAIKKTVKSEAAVSTFVETLVMSPIFFLLILFMDRQGSGAVGTLQGWQWLLLPVAGVVTTVPLVLFSAGMKTTSMALAGVLMYVNPTLQLLLSVWLYGEEFTTTHAILFCFVWCALVLYMLSDVLERHKQRTKKEDAPCV